MSFISTCKQIDGQVPRTYLRHTSLSPDISSTTCLKHRKTVTGANTLWISPWTSEGSWEWPLLDSIQCLGAFAIVNPTRRWGNYQSKQLRLHHHSEHKNILHIFGHTVISSLMSFVLLSSFPHVLNPICFCWNVQLSRRVFILERSWRVFTRERGRVWCGRESARREGTERVFVGGVRDC